MISNLGRSVLTYQYNSEFKSNAIENNPTLLDIDDLFECNVAPKIDFQISDEYDWTKSSAANYSKKFAPMEFINYEYGKSLIDYTYHGYYSPERQTKVHNPIIDYYTNIAMNLILSSPHLKQNPWVMFTAGPMGAGKTHTLQWLNHLDAIPLSSFLKLSPDRVKRFMPEYEMYLKYDEKNVGRMLRKEVGYLCEVVFWEILYSSNACVWMDSSLRHTEFFNALFKQIHLRLPNHRIALMNIKCKEEIVFERAKKRAKITGRHVPESDIQESIDSVPQSVEALSDFADVVAHIDNNETPKLLQIICKDQKNSNKESVIINDPTWADFREVWSEHSFFSSPISSKL